MEELTEKYIAQCKEIIQSNDKVGAQKLQGNILAAFSSQIKGISDDLDDDWIDINGNGCDIYGDYISNIEKLKCKLEVFLATGCANQNEIHANKSLNVKVDNSSNNSSVNNNSNSNTNNNTIDWNVIFREARKEIEENESITEEDTEEVLKKIDEIEEINKADESIKKKWSRLKSTIKWTSTQGVSIATTILNLITAILKFQSK